MKKSYAFKRTLAGVLAVLTVAAYVPANVGAFKAASGFGLVASAATTYQIKWEGLGQYLTKIEGAGENLGTSTLTKTEAWPFEEKKEIKVVSSVPLDMTAWGKGQWTSSKQDTDYADGNAYKLQVSSNSTVFTYTFILIKATELKALKTAPTVFNVAVGPKNETTNVINATLKPLADTVGREIKFADDTYIKVGVKKDAVDDFTAKKFDANNQVALDAAGMKTKQYVAAQTPFTAYMVSKKDVKQTAQKAKTDGDGNVTGWEDDDTVTVAAEKVTYDYVDSYTAVYDSKLMLYIAEVEVPYLKPVADVETYTNQEKTQKTTDTTTMSAEIYLSDTYDSTKATFKESDNKLLGNGNGMQNAVVASILGETTNSKSEKIDLDNAGVVENGKAVTIKFDAIEKLVQGDTRKPKVTIKKDGTDITKWDNTTGKGKSDGDTDWSGVALTAVDGRYFKNGTAEYFYATEPGKYDVELAVYVEENGNIVKKTISYSFTIKAKDALTAENILIKLDMPYGIITDKTVYKDDDSGKYYIKDDSVDYHGVAETVEANQLKTLKAFCAVKDKKGEILGYEVENFTDKKTTASTKFVTPGATQYYAKSNGIVDITIPADYDGSVSAKLLIEVRTLNKETSEMDNLGWTEGDQYDIEDIRSLADADVVNRMTVQVYNSEYGGSKKDPKPVVVKWRLSKAGENSVYKFAEDKVGQEAKANGVVCSIDEVDSLKAKIFDAIVLKQYTIKDFTFGYLPGEYSLNTNTMDDLNTGLPTAKGTYTVFFIVDDQAVATIKVVVSGKMIRSAIPSAQLTKTFGDKLDFKGFYFKDSDGKKVTDIKETISYTDLVAGVYLAKFVVNTKTGEDTDELELEKDGSYKLGAEIAEWNTKALAPGKYIVETNAKSVDNGTYTIAKKQYVVTIKKKTLTADMITCPTFNVGGTHNVTAEDFICKFKDAYENEQEIPLKITKGETSKSAAGEYEVYVEASTASKGMNGYKDNIACWDTTAPTPKDVVTSKPSDYIDGNIKVYWHICKNGTALNGLAFDEEATTLYDAGRIHFEVNRRDNVTGTIKRFGIVLDKQGKLPADAKNDEAEKFLQVGNGLVEGTQGDKQKGTLKYGVNIKVVNVETGIWARPYIETTDGTIYYGKPIYRNITDEATDKLKLMFANNSTEGLTPYNADNLAKFEDPAHNGAPKTFIAAKTKSSINNAVVGDSAIQCGYDKNAGKYYLYSSMQKLNSSVQANVQQSGVVYDKFGLIGKDGKLISDPTVTADKALTLANGVNAEDIKAGQKVIGIGKAKANNSVLSGQEYGANVTPADGISGVWARAYVKLSDTLIIYTDPVYIESLSDHYTFKDVVEGRDQVQIASTWKAEKLDTGAAEFRFKLLPGKDGLTMKACGVVADRYGEFLTYNAKEQKYTLSDELKAKASKALLLGSTYRVGSVSSVSNNTYTGSYTPKVADNGTIIPIVVRPYITFTTKDGNEITVYGDVLAVQTASGSLTK